MFGLQERQCCQLACQAAAAATCALEGAGVRALHHKLFLVHLHIRAMIMTGDKQHCNKALAPPPLAVSGSFCQTPLVSA